MKELTIEQKAQRYDEAIKKAKDFYKGYKQRDNQLYANDLETTFPELRESKDEKIRQKFIKLVKMSNEVGGFALHKWEADEMLAWLEKQGCPKSTKNIVETWKDMRLEVYQQASGNRHEPNYSDDSTKMFSLNDIDEIIEKMSEQNPADKVEPKFQNGQWIVWQNKCYKVNDNGCGYELIDQNGLSTSLEYGTVDESAHLWTIQDARDGDVLASKNGLSILIFRNLDTSTSFSSYYNIQGKGELGWSNECFMPATKSQRDTLIKAMADAGYTFDFEKKELKKIEDEEYNGEDYGIDGLYHAQRILEKTLGSVGGYQTDDGILSHKCAITAVKKLYEQKPAEWSEEDIRNIENIDSVLFYDKDLPEETCMRLRNWLKSLKPNKDMVEALRTEYEKGRADTIAEMKSSWSEEDEHLSYWTIHNLTELKNRFGDNYGDSGKCIDWIKQLKQRIGG